MQSSALIIAIAIVLATVIFALLSIRRMETSPQEYLVGGRGFGAFFLWVLLAGEIYTSFTFLGAAGWAYTFGAPAFYILAYGTVGYVFWYFFLPWIWRLGKKHNLLTAPDLFAHCYGNKPLTTLVSILYCLSVIPYVTLQLSALQIFLTIAGYGTINAELGAGIAYLLIVAFVFATGLRGTAWTSIVKDGLVIAALLFAGIALPIQFFGSPAGLFDQLIKAHPAMLTLGASNAPKGTAWFVSTVVLSGFGYFMGPHSIAAVYSAKDENVLRRNAMLLPLYQLVIVLVLFAGLGAVLITPGLRGAAADQSFLVVVQRYYPNWMLGFITAAGMLCALVPSTALLLCVAGILAKNIGGDLFGLALEDRARVIATRAMVALVGLGALILWIAYKTQIVDLLLLYYNGVSQLAPGCIAAYFRLRVTAWGVGAGILAGTAVASYLASPGVTPPLGLNPGLVGLAINIAMLALISLATRNNPGKTPAYPRAD